MKILKREPSNSIARTELWTVQGDAIEYPFLVYVTTPMPMTPKPEKGWHGIVVTDGSLGTGAMSSVAGYLGMGEMPPAGMALSSG